MEILSHRFFSGPNRHSLESSLEVIVDLKELRDRSTLEHPCFVEHLLAVMPGLDRHHCSRGVPGGFCQRLHQGTYLGHVTEHVGLELLYLAGELGTYGKTREQDSPQIVMIVIETTTEKGGLLALEHAMDIVTALWAETPINFSEHQQTVRNGVARARLGPSTAAIAASAMARGIPVERLDDQSHVRLGQGVAQRRILGTMTDRTSALAMDICQDKTWTKEILSQAGIRVPLGTTVTSEADACRMAREYGYPVVVKPQDGQQGEGVAMNLMSHREVARAFQTASTIDKKGRVIVEQQVSGAPYRLLVVGDDMVAATLRIPPAIVGDGMHTVEELVDQINLEPNRGAGHDFPMSQVALDSVALLTLAQQGYEPKTVVPVGTKVSVRPTANMSTGATAIDVTDKISPDLARDAVRAAQAVGLDVAGIDLVTPTLDTGLVMAQGAIVEINASPGLRMHLYPSQGTARPVGEHIVSHLFGASNGRIPVAAVTGTNGKTTVTRMLAHIWSHAGKRVGMTTTDGIHIGDRLVQRGDLTGPWSHRLVLNDPSVEIAVLETARGGMARGGLGFDACDVGIVTNIGQDHLGLEGIDTLEDLVHLKALVVDVVLPTGAAVLNADDPYVLSMAPRCRGRVILFSNRERGEVLNRHLEQGHEAVYLKRGHLVYAQGFEETRLMGCRVLPATLYGAAPMNVANAAAAAAAALGMGLTPREVTDGLLTFPAGGTGLNRGRLELTTYEDFRVLLDYGHNAPAIRALSEVVQRLKAKEVVWVLGLPGDRRDGDLRDAVRVVAEHCQRVVVREDHDLRGRQPGELASLICQELLAAGVRAQQIETVLDEASAVRHAVSTAAAGSLVVALYERYGEVQEALAEAVQARSQFVSRGLDQALSGV